MKTELQILMLEDNQLDAELNLVQISQLEEYNCFTKIIQDRDEYIVEIESSSPPDLILCDYNLPQYNGMQALTDLNERGKLIPFIFVTGTMQEEVAVDAIKAGAWDYVVKDRLFRLPLAIKGVLNLKNERLLAIKAENNLKKLIKSIDETSVQIIITDKDHKIEYINKKVSEVSGFTKDSLIGKNAELLNKFYNDDETYKRVINCLQNGEVFRGEINVRDKNNKEGWELISISPIKDESGDIINYVGIKEDISLKKKMENDLRLALEKAEESNNLKTAFLHNVSHEIRTPLNVICGFSNLLNDSSYTGEEKNNFVNIINNNSGQLLSILNDIFMISNIETKQDNLQLENICINDLLDELLEMFLNQIDKNLQLRLNKSLSDNKSVINSDKTKLTQIFTNLLNNAIKFTTQGTVEFGYLLDNQYLRFYVKDSGIGIPTELQNVIFERFRQADTSVNRKFGGSGLGLAIAKGYTELLGGKIWVESEPDNGSEFIFTIPYAELKI